MSSNNISIYFIVCAIYHEIVKKFSKIVFINLVERIVVLYLWKKNILLLYMFTLILQTTTKI